MAAAAASDAKERGRARGATSSSLSKGPIHVEDLTGEDEPSSSSSPLVEFNEADMMKMMGFTGFDSTKGKSPLCGVVVISSCHFK